MKKYKILPKTDTSNQLHQEISDTAYATPVNLKIKEKRKKVVADKTTELAEILVITSYPPRECGIATYSQDLIASLNNKFSNSLSMKVCALESGDTTYSYPEEVKYVLKTSIAGEYKNLAAAINRDAHVEIVLIQHEFGFYREQEDAFLELLSDIEKPIVVVFHTVLPHPNKALKSKINYIATVCESIVVMTHTSSDILKNEYGVAPELISVIAHGTHLVPHLGKQFLKAKYGLTHRKVLTTFGLLSSGKSIETTIDALPAIVKQNPDVVFLVIGKTHPEVVKYEGEKYRLSLEALVKKHKLEDHVIFINRYMPLNELLEYLQLTDIYLFTTNDPNQAVSGTFAYAMSCSCPIISTPIPHAKELLTKDTGIIFDFLNSQQLADAVISLVNNDQLRREMSLDTLQNIVFTAWENSAVAHALLFEQISNSKITLNFNLPPVNLDHLKRMTTDFGMIQFSRVNQPDIRSGYTLDDNARALIAACMYFEHTGDQTILVEVGKYLNVIVFCQQLNGDFLNYIDEQLHFTQQNNETNLEDSNGRAIWALGYLVSLAGLMPSEMILKAEKCIENALPFLETMHSTRSMAFSIKGLFYYHSVTKSPIVQDLIKEFANRMVQMYKHETTDKWQWYESYLTYANSLLPEAMLYSWVLTKVPIYKDVALSSFNFLMSHIYNKNGIEVISNRTWLLKGEKQGKFGEQPIDVAYTIMSLAKFYDVFQVEDFRSKMVIAFNWFLGKNRLHQIVYNPCTGGCYDGLEEHHVNINQGAESTLSYLMARLVMGKYDE